MSFSIHPKEMRIPTSTGYLDRTLLPNSDTDWQMGPIQKEKYRTYGESITVEDLTVLCIATQVWGPSVGRKAVVKIKI